MISKLKYNMIAPKKVNLIAKLVRGAKAKEALTTLKFTPKKAAKLLYKAIKSATSNAENNFKQKIEDLYIKEILVSSGPMYKRHMPVSRGRAHPILKRTTHITIEIGVLGKPAKTEKEKPVETKVKKEVVTKK